MLNVKKLSIVKAVLFGLVLSNTGIAAGAAAGAGVPLPDAAGAAVVVAPVSTFLSGLSPLPADDVAGVGAAVDVLNKTTIATFAGIRCLWLADHEPAPGLKAANTQEAGRYFALVPAGHPYDARDEGITRTITAIAVDHRVSVAAIKAVYANAQTIADLHMSMAERNLWILLHSMGFLSSPGEAGGKWEAEVALRQEYRDAINTYLAEVLPGAGGADAAMD